MLCSTAAFAAAASFTPSSFSDGGVALVVGQSAASSDLKAALDLTANLAPATSTSTSSSATVTGGDAVAILSGTDNLNLGNALTIVGTVNDEDMETFLASGEYKDTNKVKYDYDQEISVAATTLTYSTSSAYEDKTPTIGLFYEKDADVLTYSVDFNLLNFTDAIGTDLPLMGNMYYVLDYSATDGLTLLDSSASATITEGETKTLTVDGKSYEVTLNFVGDSSPDYAKFTVNGESLDKIEEGSDDELVDGSFLAVKEVLYSGKESGTSQVEFTIGTGKLLLPTAGEIEMNDDRVVNVDSTVSSATGIITIDWNTDAKTVLTKAGDEIILPGFKTIKVSYSGMNFPEAEKTVLDAAGVLELQTYVKDGAVTIPLVNYDGINATTGNLTYIGDDTDSKLVLGSASTTNSSVSLSDVGDYFIATYASGDDFESYVFQLDSIKYGTDGKTEVILDNMAGGDDITFADIARTRTKNEITFVLAAANETTEDVIIYVQGSAISTRKLATQDGLSINLANLVTTTNFTADGFSLTFDEQDKDKDFEDGPSFTVTLTETADENIHVSATNVTTLETKTNDVYEGYVVSDLATKVTLDKTDADAHDFTVSYNGQEVKADVFVAASSATVSAGSSGSTTTSGVMTVYDNEISSASNKNLIVIGGSCVNTVAAELLGGALCGDAFTEKTSIKSGEALIESFTRGTKTALLVAGYNAEDTTKAVTYLSNNNVNTAVGSKLKVTAANAATAITA